MLAFTLLLNDVVVAVVIAAVDVAVVVAVVADPVEICQCVRMRCTN